MTVDDQRQGSSTGQPTPEADTVKPAAVPASIADRPTIGAVKEGLK